MRVKKAIRTVFSGIGLQFLKIIFNFLIRGAFIATLGPSILGINSLFANIMTLLSVTELGLGGAITAHLYKPLAQKDDHRVSVLMEIYRRLYLGIGFLILLVGGVITLFVNTLVSGYNGNLNLRLVFILFVLNSALSYMSSYRNVIISADQNGYIVNRVLNVGFIIQAALQLMSLYLFENYWLFLISGILVMLLQNMFLNYLSTKMYGRVFSIVSSVSKTDFNSILDYAKPMMLYMVSGVINTGTDNIIISKFLGVVTVGKYANYTIVTTAIQSIISVLFSSLTAMVGNAHYDENVDSEELFSRVNFLALWINSFLAGGVFLFINPFIEIWLGKGFVFNTVTIGIISMNMFLIGISQPLIVFREATGSFTINQYKPLWAAILNIVFSIVLVQLIGLAGVLLGTILSRLLTYFWNDPLVLYKYYFKKNVRTYFFDVSRFAIITIMFLIIFKVLSVDTFSVPTFILMVLGYMATFNIVMVLANFKSERFKYFWNMLRKGIGI